MGKKNRKRIHPEEKTAANSSGARPRILFAVGDADSFYTENRIWRLAKHLQAQAEWEVSCVASDEVTQKMAADNGVPSAVVPLTPRAPNWDEQLSTVNELINKTADIVIPGSRLPLWKSIAPDEFRGSMILFGARPNLGLHVDLVIAPLMGVDNNSLNASGLYTTVVSQARAQGIPVLGLEVSPLGNRYTLCQLPADIYAVKSHWSKNFLVARGIAAPEQASVLTAEETSLLRPGVDSYADAYFEKERLAREILKLKHDRLIVLVPHHVAFIWEVRQILRVLAELPEPVSVVVQASAHAIRRQFTEPELIARAYEAEIKRLDHFVINTQIGVGLMAQIADLVISPFAGTTSEGAALRRKPVIISQLMTDESSDGEFIRWQPDARKIPAVIDEWRKQGILGRLRLGDIARQMIARRVQRAA